VSSLFIYWSRHGRDHMIVGVSTTYAISAYHHWCCEFESDQGEGTTLCDKVCQCLAAGRWYPLVSSTNKTDRHDITEILSKVALNTIKQTTNTIYLNENRDILIVKIIRQVTSSTPLGEGGYSTSRSRPKLYSRKISIAMVQYWRAACTKNT
jgi:hypothetical protein